MSLVLKLNNGKTFVGKVKKNEIGVGELFYEFENNDVPATTISDFPDTLILENDSAHILRIYILGNSETTKSKVMKEFYCLASRVSGVINISDEVIVQTIGDGVLTPCFFGVANHVDADKIKFSINNSSAEITNWRIKIYKDTLNY